MRVVSLRARSVSIESSTKEWEVEYTRRCSLLALHLLVGSFVVLIVILLVLVKVFTILGSFGEVNLLATSTTATVDDVVEVDFVQIVIVVIFNFCVRNTVSELLQCVCNEVYVE